MAVAKPYESRVPLQGRLNVRATPDAFGAGVGEALQNLGRSSMAQAEGQMGLARGLSEFAQSANIISEMAYKMDVEDDVTSVHTTMAKSRVKLQEELVKLQNSTAPGDNTFVTRAMETADKYFEEARQGVKTRIGQQTFDRESSNMTAMIGSEAIAMQSRLRAQNASNNYTELSNTYSTIVAKDHNQFDYSLNKIYAAIDDKNSVFGSVPQPVRDELKLKAKENLMEAAARGFVDRNPGAVLDRLSPETRGVLNSNVANPPQPGLPPDLGADTVKPYSQAQITTLANKIDAPSKYDDAFKAAAKEYNLDWRELKMRAIAESGLDPNAKSSQGAGGIMQFTKETADMLGVDRNDPISSIMGAARLLAKYRNQAKGDQAIVDQLYYGGANEKQWGPNTKQYAANLSAVRQSAGIGATQSPESFAGAPMDLLKQGQNIKQNVGLPFIDELPADKWFGIMRHAEVSQRAADAQAERSRIAQTRLEQDKQKAVMKGLQNRIIDPDNNGGVVTEKDIASDPYLAPEQVQTLIGFQRAFENDKLRAGKQHPEEFTRLFNRIFASDADPQKINDPDVLRKAFGNNDISFQEYHTLEGELDKRKNGVTTLQQNFNKAFDTVRFGFSHSLEGSMNPEKAVANSYAWHMDVQSKIQSMQAENKNPMELFNPKSKDYVMSRDYLATFGAPAPQALNTGAAAVIQSAAQNENREAAPGFEVGTIYPFKNGIKRRYLGGPTNVSTSWQDVSPKD